VEAATFREAQDLGILPLLILLGVGILVPLLMACGSWCLAQRGQRIGAGVLVVTGLFMFLLCAWILVSFGVMTTEVTPAGVRVSFGWRPSYSRTIPASQIQAVEVVRYDPMAEYGGWGIRHNLHSPNDHALNQVGNQGVRLQLEGGERLLIGSEQPEALLQAIEQLPRNNPHPGDHSPLTPPG
jgi:hypothetical protein